MTREVSKQATAWFLIIVPTNKNANALADGVPKNFVHSHTIADLRSIETTGVGFRGAKYDDMNERFGMKESDAIRPWLTDFVALIGNDEASRLLEGVGKLEPLPGSGSKANIKRDNSNNTYEVGDLVAVNFAGEGKWFEGEIYSSYSNNFYSVFFDDCSQEIATFAERILPINKSVLAATSEPTE